MKSNHPEFFGLIFFIENFKANDQTNFPVNFAECHEDITCNLTSFSISNETIKKCKHL